MILEDKLRGGNWQIIASDISSRVLEKSQEGLYPIDKSNKIPVEYLKKYCLKGVKTQLGYFKISDLIKKKIQFKSINLNEHFPNIGKFHIIFLRNVMIYFNKDTRICRCRFGIDWRNFSYWFYASRNNVRLQRK